MMRIVVVLPAPFGPRKPSTWPGRGGEADVADGDQVAVALGEVRELRSLRVQTGPHVEDSNRRSINGAVFTHDIPLCQYGQRRATAYSRRPAPRKLDLVAAIC